MVKQIVWTSKADSVFTEILVYYRNRNKSNTYSRKLNKDIHQTIQLPAKYPLLGIQSDFKNIRVLTKGHFRIFYEVKAKALVIHMVWDTRQDPSKLKL